MMEEKIDWKNAKYNPKRTLGGVSEEQSINQFTEYCRENLAEAEAKLTSLDYDKTLTLLDTFGITDIAVANRILSACKAALATSEKKQETDPEKPLDDMFASEDIPMPQVNKPSKAAPVAKPKMNYSEEMSEFKKLEEDFLGKRL